MTDRADQGRRLGLRGRAALVAAALAAAVSVVAAHSQQDQPLVVAGTIAALTRGGEGASAAGGVGAIVTVGRSRIVIPPDVKIQFPAASMALDDVFHDAPAGCRLRGESGLAKADVCRTDPDGVAAAAAKRPASGESAAESPLETELAAARASIEVAKAADGTLVAVRVQITKNIEQLMGGVTFVNEADGYVRINGYFREDTGGTLVRINDPSRQQSDQRGAACGAGPNCSPDVRFRVDSVAFSVRFDRGNPACIGSDAQGCYASNRKIPDDDTLSPVPIRVGDNLVAAGAFETIRGERFFSAQSLQVQAVLSGDR